MTAPTPLIPSGASIALISPASPVEPAEIAEGKKWLDSLGYSVVEGKNLYTRERFLAGDDNSRAQEFMDAWCDPDIHAIICARGGYGSQRILPLLEWEEIKKHTKPLFGFSDITALQLALVARAGKGSYSGFVLAGDEGKNRKEFTDILAGNITPPAYLGGCLSLICSLLGSSYLPDFRGSHMIIEEVGEKPYRVDKMLSSLELAGCFESCPDVTFGNFKNCLSTDPGDGDIEEVLSQWEERIAKPVYYKPSYGHGAGEIIRCQ